MLQRNDDHKINFDIVSLTLIGFQQIANMSINQKPLKLLHLLPRSL